MDRTEALQLVVDLSGETSLARVAQPSGVREYNFPELLKDLREAINDQPGSPAPLEDRVVEALSVLTGLPQDWISLPAAAGLSPVAGAATISQDTSNDTFEPIRDAAAGKITLPVEAETEYTLSGLELETLLLQIAGAATSPQYRAHPDEPFPAEDVVRSVQAHCIESGKLFAEAAERARTRRGDA